MMRFTAKPISLALVALVGLSGLLTFEGDRFWLVKGAARAQQARQESTAWWARFRGPNGSGVAEKDKPPVQFGPLSKLLWKTALPAGHSSPIVWDRHIFLTGLENDKLVVIALRRADGKLLWKQTIPAEKIEKVHAFNSPAAPTPATDGQRVYVYFGSYGLMAFDFAGKEIWRKPLPLPPTQYGTASSPIVYDDKVLLQRDGNDGKSELLAVDGKSGATVWQTARPSQRESWSTPTIWSNDGQDELLVVGNGRLVAYSPKDGTERWWVGGLSFAPITMAVSGDGLIFASTKTIAGAPGDRIELPTWDALLQYDQNKDGKIAEDEFPADMGIHLRKDVPKETPGNFMPIREIVTRRDLDKDKAISKSEWEGMLSFMEKISDVVVAVRPGGTGDCTKSHVAWTASRGIAEMPSPLFYMGRLYIVRDGGMVTSYEPATGKVILDRQRLGVLGQYVASPVAADGRIYAASETGTVVVFSAGDSLEVLARNELGEGIRATPAISANKLYVRTLNHLWAFGN